MSSVEKNLNSGEVQYFTGYFFYSQWKLSSPSEMTDIDDLFNPIGTDQVGVALISWSTINNAIYGALIHDMPFVAGPIFILMVSFSASRESTRSGSDAFLSQAYVGHVFYRKNNER